MYLSLIICTYQRPKALLRLLHSVNVQSIYPREILIIDGSTDNDTTQMLKTNHFNNLKYHKVKPNQRGLTKQRNIGITLCDKSTDIVAFLDDDIVLDKNYFKQLIQTYKVKPLAVAVGGYITNETNWLKKETLKTNNRYFCIDNYCRIESIRFKIRKIFGLTANTPPGYLPKFSHGRSISFLPPTNKIYPVEHFMGGVASYKFDVFTKLQFSEYFEGYGLYEDADFCIRLLKHGRLYVSTAARCVHYHDALGRPNSFLYGQMVVKNGWYIWRLRWPNPSILHKIKWHLTCILLIKLRFSNIFTTRQKQQAFRESMGRLWAWTKLWFSKPKIIR